MKKKILISTGGSGGHVIPAITIYDHLKNDYDVAISTDVRGFRYLNNENYKTFLIDTPRLNRLIYIPFSILVIFFLTIKSLLLFKREKINILISTGGYMSLPLCLAAKVLKIKIFLLEPNMIIGRANKFFLNICEKIICYDNNIINFPKKFINKLIVLTPLLRKKYYERNNNLKIDKKFTVIVIGGSQGAKIFDELLHKTFIKISKIKPLKVIHQTNEANINTLKNLYLKNKVENIVFEFDQNLYRLLSQADLCITRAGASSLAEIASLKLPFIAIPLPTSKDNHQFQNAKYYENKNCCWIIDQNNFNQLKLEDLLLDILKNGDDFIKKKNNLENLNYQNTWNSVNQNLLKIINEN
ncbi:UDP-N-acetylglucosamine--N-acetylmuramyl-(pentapeptide) pyrophosphoryl-undecaprenol N-acetylglucosamine transferase [Candidatus Pelagibacter bacterium nBUS_30]|jgi:UDP-N-acetylglucosamine--N-acetylmuramyl-(pentapeptide) pyrophosphoryl-undecaprenol N-acetylglucosamine transferase|uniref:UDP-N-acetylglucosamine--N-acetylmuramyl- (pentapeptide) pyrophosphoryl-undecaprenol N-acetylglucosamine transferase n=1 Tax=Candidatus Pelagibacter bacterium nBUS_30 TaxID=3374191 RepID=UPI003EC0E836